MTEKVIFRISEIIDIDKLERESDRLLMLGVAIAVCFHALLGMYITFNKPVLPVVNQIPFDIIVKPPRLKKQFTIGRRSIRKSYRYRKTAAARMPSGSFPVKSPALPGVPLPGLDMDVNGDRDELKSPVDESLEAMEKKLSIPKDIIPPDYRLFTDTGDYKSMIIVPPGNKMAVQGYTHIPVAVGRYLNPPDTLRYAIHNLAGTLKYYTNIHAAADRQVHLFKPSVVEEIIDAVTNLRDTSDREIYRYPFIYITSSTPFRLTDDEKYNLGWYIYSGGFLVIDNGMSGKNTRKSLINMVRDAFFRTIEVLDGTPPFVDYGTFKLIGHGHELYHCFFDFDEGPPGKKEITGIFLGHRLVGIIADSYGTSWYDRSNEKHLKMGVNMVVYAVTREKGSYSYGSGKWTYQPRQYATNIW